jgi:hypothetical protein
MQITYAKIKGEGKTASQVQSDHIDIDRLEFPKAIAKIIGLRKETINFWKKLGCRFVGRKTTVRWVRDFMTTLSGGENHGIA